MHHNKLWTNFKELGIPDHLIYRKRNLYTGQVCMYIFFYTGQETTLNWTWKTDGFNFAKGERQGCISSPCLFNFYAKDIMQNAKLDESRLL